METSTALSFVKRSSNHTVTLTAVSGHCALARARLAVIWFGRSIKPPL